MKDLPDPVDFPPEPGAEPHLKSVLVTAAAASKAAETDTTKLARARPRGAR
jgi:hypothetical protein